MSARKTATTALILLAVLTSACSGAVQGAGEDPTLTPQEVMGKRLFGEYCTSCHSTRPDLVVVGPSLAGIGRAAAERVPEIDARTYIETSIKDPDAFVVDGFENRMLTSLGETLTQEEVDALVAYLMTLE